MAFANFNDISSVSPSNPSLHLHDIYKEYAIRNISHIIWLCFQCQSLWPPSPPSWADGCLGKPFANSCLLVRCWRWWRWWRWSWWWWWWWWWWWQSVKCLEHKMAKVNRVSAILKDWCKLVFLFTGLQKCEREKCWNFKETSLTSTWCTEYPCIARHAGIFNEFNPSNLFLISTVCELVTIIQIILTLQFTLKSNYVLQYITL